MNILCACDNNYAPYCGIMLTSLFETNKENKLCVYILCNNVDQNDTDKFAKLGNKYSQDINLINVKDLDSYNFPIWAKDHISLVTYLRLFVTSLLPETVDRVLYLDCDIIVNHSIQDLEKIDLTDKSAAVVIDGGEYDDKKRIENLGITSENLYYNAGVLLINLDYWRKNNLQEKFLNFIEKHRKNLLYHDQDALNGILQGTVKYLSIKYNYQTTFQLRDLLPKYDAKLRNEIIKSNENNIAIIHYCTPVKPWNFWHFAYPFDKVWQKYKKMSLWKDTSYKQSLKVRLTCKILSLLCKLHLKKIDLY